MRKIGGALSGLAIASLALAGCGIEPVDYIAPAPAAPGCEVIITRDARLPFPDDSAPTPVASLIGPAGQDGGQDGGADPVQDASEQPGAAYEKIVTMLEVPTEPPVAETAETETPAAAPEARRIAPEEPISDSVLVLSGGSQQGAFGAGFIKQWADARTAAGKASLPRFRLVTGISTGSLQSTFAFLDRPGVPLAEYLITNESALLEPLVDGKLDDKPILAARSLATEGTLARLTGLRTRLRELISHEVLLAVAAEADAGRSLLVGAVEMDSGEAAIFDLTKAAQIYTKSFRAKPEGAAAHDGAFMRDCYVEALMASSSVPMQADPVFINNRMYIDGGARFGVLVDLTAEAYHDALEKSEAGANADPAPRNLFLIVNATLEVPELCSLRRCDPTVAVDDAEEPRPAHGEWNFVQLAQRSVSVMINQAYRSSVFIAEGQYSEKEFTTRFVRLDPAHLNFATPITFAGTALPAKTCRQWRAEDEAIASPSEFFPRYMHCLARYGAQDAKLAAFIAAE